MAGKDIYNLTEVYMSKQMNEMPLIALLVDSNTERAEIVEAGLSGAAVTRLSSSAPDKLLASIDKLQPDVIIMDCDSPDKDMIESLKKVSQHNPKPIVMFVEDGDGSLAKEAVHAGVSAYIVDGLQASRVRPVVEVAVERFKMFDELKKELVKSKESLEARKIIERAKGILMDKRNLSEEGAFRSMRELAMKESVTIKKIAENILSVSHLLDGV